MALKGEKTSYKTTFVSYIESDSCIIAFLKVLSKTSKGRYLDFKRASFASQKGVNWKPIYALLVCSLRIFFTITHIFTGAIETLKDRSMRKSIVLLFSYLNLIQLLSFYFVFHLLCLQVTCYLVNLLPCQPKKRSSVTLSLFYPVFVLLLPCLNLTLSQGSLVILSTVIVVLFV